eukprot:764958-Hanusia_phi.AAC.1
MLEKQHKNDSREETNLRFSRKHAATVKPSPNASLATASERLAKKSKIEGSGGRTRWHRGRGKASEGGGEGRGEGGGLREEEENRVENMEKDRDGRRWWSFLH